MASPILGVKFGVCNVSTLYTVRSFASMNVFMGHWLKAHSARNRSKYLSTHLRLCSLQPFFAIADIPFDLPHNTDKTFFHQLPQNHFCLAEQILSFIWKAFFCHINCKFNFFTSWEQVSKPYFLVHTKKIRVYTFHYTDVRHFGNDTSTIACIFLQSICFECAFERCNKSMIRWKTNMDGSSSASF